MSSNALKELSLKMEFVRFAISDVPSVWVQPNFVSLVQRVDIYLMVPVGTFAQALW